MFEPLSFEFHKVGKMIKSSKQRFTWKILLDNLDYTVDMFYSKYSTKVKILVNGELALSTKATEQQLYKFLIRYRSLSVVKVGDMFDLRCEKLSAEAILSGRQKIKSNKLQTKSVPKVQLRRSLPACLPSEVPTVNFKKTVKNVDLLEFESTNPFDIVEDNLPVLNKATSMINSGSQVPWPTETFYSASRRRY